MDISEIKSKISLIAHDVGSMVPYEEDDMPDDPDELCEYLCEIAKSLHSSANRIAGYAGLSARIASKGR